MMDAKRMNARIDAKKKLKKDKNGTPSIVGPFSTCIKIEDVISKAAISKP